MTKNCKQLNEINDFLAEFYLLFYFWLCGSCMGFSLVLENGGYLQVAGLRCHCSGFSVAECGLQGAWFSAAVARGLPAAAPGSRAQARWLRRMGLAACHVGSSQFRDGSLLLHCKWILYPLSHLGSPLLLVGWCFYL